MARPKLGLKSPSKPDGGSLDAIARALAAPLSGGLYGLAGVNLPKGDAVTEGTSK